LQELVCSYVFSPVCVGDVNLFLGSPVASILEWTEVTPK
jgi:hypothetical protein